jgi:uracil-DNA glycosylase
MPDDPRAELASVAAAARAHLEIEQSLGNRGLSLLAPASADVPASAMPAAAPPPATGAAPSVLAPVMPASDASTASVERAALEPAEKHRRLELMAREASTCTSCALHERRKQSVFARGNPNAELAFVGEGPGQEEDLQGFPFVGPAGQLLDRMVAAMGYARDDVYVCNVVKCRPPENRTPRPEEAIACAKFLVPQLELVAPRVMVALGRCAAENLGLVGPGGGWRGRWGTWHGIPVMPTYHPAYLLRSPEYKRVVWEDLQQVMGRLGRTPPPRTPRA